MQVVTGAEELLQATLDRVCRCPARNDYIELHFTTAEGAWEWCFPKPDEEGKPAPTPLALTLGRYGVQARLIHDEGLGYAVPSASALPMILGGVQVRVERRLVRTGR